MNLLLGALTASMTVVSAGAGGGPGPQTSRDLEYALPPLDAPCVAEACGRALVNDFALDLGEPGGPRAGEVRVLLDDRFYLGLRANEDRRSVTLSDARWDLELEHRDEVATVAGELRAPRVRLGLRAEDHQPEAGDGWRVSAEAALRLGPDLELVVAAVEDDRSRPLDGSGDPLRMSTTSFSLGALWQRGARLEVSGRLLTGEVVTAEGLELDRRAFELESVYQARRWSLRGELGLSDLSGRFDRSEAMAAAGLSYRVTPRLVAHADARERYEADLGSLERDLAVGATYYARRFRFPRGGEAARRTVELARRAYGLGFNERRDHDLEGRRRLRQRLAQSAARDELAPLIEELYRSQIDGRPVPLAGVSWRRDSDNLDGSRLLEREVFVAVPWPRRDGPHPLSPDERATEFLRLRYVRLERQISSGLATEGSILELDVSLRRELRLRFRWTDPAATGLQLAQKTQERRSFSAQVVYRRGI